MKDLIQFQIQILKNVYKITKGGCRDTKICFQFSSPIFSRTLIILLLGTPFQNSQKKNIFRSVINITASSLYLLLPSGGRLIGRQPKNDKFSRQLTK